MFNRDRDNSPLVAPIGLSENASGAVTGTMDPREEWRPDGQTATVGSTTPHTSRAASLVPFLGLEMIVYRILNAADVDPSYYLNFAAVVTKP